MLASYKVTHVLLKIKKPFEEEEQVKEVMLSAVESLFEGFGNRRNHVID
jgi:hypothetical protein